MPGSLSSSEVGSAAASQAHHWENHLILATRGIILGIQLPVRGALRERGGGSSCPASKAQFAVQMCSSINSVY